MMRELDPILAVDWEAMSSELGSRVALFCILDDLYRLVEKAKKETR